MTNSRRPSLPTGPGADEGTDQSRSIKHVVRQASTRFNHWATRQQARSREASVSGMPRCNSHEVDRRDTRAPSPKTDLPALDMKRSSSLPGNFPELTAATVGNRTRLSPVLNASPIVEPPPRKDSKKQDPVEDMVHAALKTSSKLQTYVSQVIGQRLVDSADGMRITHTKEDVARALPSKEAVRRRLLFVCASMSLAADFQEFQRRQSRKSRQAPRKDSIDSPVSPVSPLGMMSGAKQQALEDFIAAQAPIDKDERNDLEAAVLLGTKAQIVNAIGQSLRLGSSLGLMCAFEARRLSDLSYQKFPELRMLLREHASPTERIRSFSSTMDPWWSKQLDDYHSHYTSIRSKSSSKPTALLSTDLPKSPKAPKLARISRTVSHSVRSVKSVKSARSISDAGSLTRRKRLASGAVSPTNGSLRRVSVRASRLAARRNSPGRPMLDKPLPPPAPVPAIPRRSSQRVAHSRYSLLPGSVPTGDAQRRASTRPRKTSSPAQTPPAAGGSEIHIASQYTKTETKQEKKKSIMKHKRSQIIYPASTAPDVENRIENFLQELQTQVWHGLRGYPRLGSMQAVAAKG